MLIGMRVIANGIRKRRQQMSSFEIAITFGWCVQVFLLVFVTTLIIRKTIVEDEKRILNKKDPDVVVVLNDDNYGFTGRLP